MNRYLLAVTLAVACAAPALAAHKTPAHPKAAIPHYAAPVQVITAPVMNAQELDQYVVADTSTVTGGFLRNQDYAIVVSLDPSSTVGINTTIVGPVDGSGNVNVDVQAFTATIKQQDGSPQLSGAALRTGCSGTPACTFTTTAITTLYAIIYAGPSLTGTSTITCYDNTSATGDFIIAYTANWGNTQIVTYGPTGYHLQNGKVSCQTGGAVLGATANIIVLAR